MMRVLGDRILVALPPEPEEIISAGGLYLARDPDRVQTPTRGLVVALGEKSGTVDIDEVTAILSEQPPYEDRYLLDSVIAAVKTLRPAPFDVAVGDCVVFPAFVGDEYEDAGIRYVVLHESDVIGIVDPKSEAA